MKLWWELCLEDSYNLLLIKKREEREEKQFEVDTMEQENL